MNEEKKSKEHRHLPEGEKATPVKACTSKWYVNWPLSEPNEDGKTALMQLKEKGATEESIQNAVEQVTVTSSTLPLGQKASVLCLIESETKVQIGSVLMDDTGVSWSVRNDDTEYDTEIQYWKLQIERPKEAQLESSKGNGDLVALPLSNGRFGQGSRLP